MVHVLDHGLKSKYKLEQYCCILHVACPTSNIPKIFTGSIYLPLTLSKTEIRFQDSKLQTVSVNINQIHQHDSLS